MSRVTPPVTKLTHVARSISSSAGAGRQAGLREASRHGKPSELVGDSSKRLLRKNELSYDHDSLTSRAFHTLPTRRPSTSTRPIPLMQGFRTSAPKQAAHDTSSMDNVSLPSILTAPSDAIINLRVPLLPDYYAPDRSPFHAVETLDPAVPSAQIHVVAASPSTVAALSEVVGNDAVDVSLEQLVAGFAAQSEPPRPAQPGVLGELWNGIVEDVFGPKGNAAPKLAF